MIVVAPHASRIANAGLISQDFFSSLLRTSANREITSMAHELSELANIGGGHLVAAFAMARYAERLLRNDRVRRHLKSYWPEIASMLTENITDRIPRLPGR